MILRSGQFSRFAAVLAATIALCVVCGPVALLTQASSVPATGAEAAAPAVVAAATTPTIAAAAGTLDPELADKFGQEGTVKIRIERTALTPELLSAGGRLVAEYESFVVAEVPADAIPDAEGVEVMADDNLILLNVGAIDTTQLAAKLLQQPRGEFAGKALHLVQFAGPIQPEWVDELAQTGVEIVTYIPSNTYLVYGDSAAIGALQTYSATAPQVQWQGAYLDEYKIDPTAAAMINGVGLAAVAGNDDRFSVQLVNDRFSNAATLAVVDQLKSAPVQDQYEIMNYVNFVAKIPPALLPQLAAQPDVVSIQPRYKPRHCDERQDEIVRGNLSGNNPGAPGYLAWLASVGFTQAQFTASNFGVDVSDSGIDDGTTSPNHFGLYVGGVMPGTSRVMYNRVVGTPNSGSTLKGCDGHGTLNSHVVAGYDDLSGFPFADASGYHYGLGVAPFVKVGSSVIFDPYYWTSPNYTTLQSSAYHDNARISTNSWGYTSGNTYNTDAQTYDYLVRDAQPTGSTYPAAGNQQMVIVFSAGNAGSSANTVAPPGTAKNIITVGAAEGVQDFGGADYCGIGTSGANSANDIISFSSRGPTSDGRKKPEIVAPGTHISGGVAQTTTPGSTGQADSCFDASGVCAGYNSDFFPNSGQEFYTASSGTSHSCPAVAGGAALVRQFFINEGMPVPSPAMTKSLLMNSARYMNGTGANDTLWSNSQGMGEMNLSEAFSRGAVTGTVFRDEDPNDMFTASGQTRVFTGSIADNTKVFRVTLAWTDAPGPTSGAAYKNNLDLTVVVGGNTYRGNVFTGALSTTGGSADIRNNAESVFLAAGVSGSYTVTVTATSINSDGVPNTGGSLDQDFALVVYNSSTCSMPSISSQPTNQTVCSGGSASFSVTASGATSYQWRKGTTNLTNGGSISGATSAALTINPVATGDAGTDYNCVVTNACGSVTSSNATLTVNVSPSISAHPSNQTVCSGGSASFSVTASGTPAPTYQWRKGTANLTNGGSISGATTATLTINPVGTGDAGTNYNCVVTNTCGSATSNNASLTVNVAPSISAQPGNQTVCSGGSASFSVTASGTPAPTYQWRKGTTNLSNGGNISGATTATLTIDPVGAGDAGTNYNCVVTNTCASATSNNATLTVNTTPSISAQPGNQTVCSGGSASFSVTAAGATSYQWRKGTTNLTNGGNIAGATTATVTINPVGTGDAGTDYNCVVTNTCGSVTSNNASLTVNVSPSISGQPSNQTACSGGSASFSVTASGTPTPTYQWRKGTTNLSNGGNIAGATTATLTINPVGTGDAAVNYNCVVTNTCGAATSNNASLTVNVGPSITGQPSNQSVCSGGSASFSVTATGTPAPTYQWRKGTTNLTNGGNISGATTATLTINPVGAGDAGTNYNCVVTNTCSSATSNNASLTINSGPSISAQPGDQTACSGGSASFTVTASGATSYQWRRGTTNLNNGGNISGATAATVTINPAGTGDAGTDYNCVVSNACGSVTSNNASLTVNSGPAVTAQPSDQAACPGGSASFSVTATGSPTPSYQWRKGTTNLVNGGNISGATAATLTINPVGAGDAAANYNCVVTNTCGSATSNNAVLTVNAGPSITGQPTNQAACSGGSASFSVAASGTPAPTHQWRKGTTDLFDGGNIAGATTATLTINPVGAGDAATDYNCVVTNTCGSATSNNVSLILNAGPSITVQPSDQTACGTGGIATFNVTASGSPAPTYQWRKGTTDLSDSGNLSGATTATLTINPIGAGDAATDYNCVVTNSCGSSTSDNAALILNAGPTITGQPTDQSACSTGGIATFSVTASGTPAPTYQWRKGTTDLSDGGNITGATTATLTINPVGAGDAAADYNCVVTNSCGSSTSNNAALTLNAGPSITDQPSDQTACGTGGSATFSVTASGTPAPTYQWRKGTTDLVDGGNLAGATTDTLTINPVGAGDAATDYNCVVTNSCGSSTSNNAALILNAGPAITGQPTDQSTCSTGGIATFSVVASGSPAPTYQWRKGTTDLLDGGNISGATTDTLTINPVGSGDAATDYNCVVTNSCGSTTSNNAALILNAGPAISGQPADQAVCSAGSASFSVTATGTPVLTYQWRKGTTDLADGGNISGATTDTLTINPVGAGDAATDYNCVVTNPCGSTTTNAAALTIGAGPAITAPPASQALVVGGTVVFSVTANSSSALSYQWRKNTLPLSDGGPISGATSATLTINPVALGDAGRYDVVVTDSCGSVTSDGAAYWERGDLNCDGSVDNFDINPFVLALTNPAAYAIAYPNCWSGLGDCDNNGTVDNFDINPFVAILTGP